MSYTYDFGSDVEDIAGALVVYLISFLFSGGLSIAMYVLRSLGTYTIAKRRELNHAWMAWVPVLDYWMLGSVSDQYQYVVKGRNKNKRKWLVGLYGAMMLVMIAFWVVYIVMIVNMVTGITGSVSESELMETVMGSAIGILGLCLPLMGLSIALTVIRYMALYDLYRSCDPDNSVAFLLVSIFVNVTEAFFIFACRKKDKGMPPRKPRNTAYIPEQPAEPVYRPAEPAYQPPVYQAEPVGTPAPEVVAEEPAAPAEEPGTGVDPWDI